MNQFQFFKMLELFTDFAFSGYIFVVLVALIIGKQKTIQPYVKPVLDISGVICLLGLIGYYGYWGLELILSWYNGVEYEGYAFLNRIAGPYWLSYWIMYLLPIVAMGLLLKKSVRVQKWMALLIVLCIRPGVWIEKVILAITSFHRDFVPSSIASYNYYHIFEVFLYGILLVVLSLLIWSFIKKK